MSVEVQKVSEETANFARYWRLLWDVGRDVLATVFKVSFSLATILLEREVS